MGRWLRSGDACSAAARCVRCCASRACTSATGRPAPRCARPCRPRRCRKQPGTTRRPTALTQPRHKHHRHKHGGRQGCSRSQRGRSVEAIPLSPKHRLLSLMSSGLVLHLILVASGCCSPPALSLFILHSMVCRPPWRILADSYTPDAKVVLAIHPQNMICRRRWRTCA